MSKKVNKIVNNEQKSKDEIMICYVNTKGKVKFIK